MKLDEYEIDYVKYFVQSKGYHYYEILGEILDHFILLLEEKKEEKPTMIFRDLVDEVYQTVGKSAFKEISESAKKRVRKKYNTIFFKNLFLFLNYKYVLITLTAGFLLYQIQVLLKNVVAYDTFQLICSIALIVFAFRYITNEYANPKFLVRKVSNYQVYIILMTTGYFFRVINKSIENPIYAEINIHYLITTLALIVKAMIIFAMAKTIKAGVEECDEMEEVYQVLK